MSKIKFFLGLWAGKFFMFFYSLLGQRKNDKPGFAAYKFDQDILKHIKKPKLTIVVTGTNGKTTTCSVIAQILKSYGFTVAYNDWGANYPAGQARCLLDAVNIFNISTKDTAIIEADEATLETTLPKIKPNYLFITNLGQDSPLRNADPLYIRKHIVEALNLTKDLKTVINADDPISADLGTLASKAIYFGADNMHTDASANHIYTVCPKCGMTPLYRYVNMNHYGDFKCPKCNNTSPKKDFNLISVDNIKNTIVVNDFEYSVPSAMLFNAYNFCGVIALLKDVGLTNADINSGFKKVVLPASRNIYKKVNDIEIIALASKGQNPSACSATFASIATDVSNKQVVLMLDEDFKDTKKTESAEWIYDTAYEPLLKDNIEKIIVAGERHLDHKIQLLMCGANPNKLVCIQEQKKVVDYIDYDSKSKIYILFDFEDLEYAKYCVEEIAKRIMEGK